MDGWMDFFHRVGITFGFADKHGSSHVTGLLCSIIPVLFPVQHIDRRTCVFRHRGAVMKHATDTGSESTRVRLREACPMAAAVWTRMEASDCWCSEEILQNVSLKRLCGRSQPRFNAAGIILSKHEWLSSFSIDLVEKNTAGKGCFAKNFTLS